MLTNQPGVDSLTETFFSGNLRLCHITTETNHTDRLYQTLWVPGVELQSSGCAHRLMRQQDRPERDPRRVE